MRSGSISTIHFQPYDPFKKSARGNEIPALHATNKTGFRCSVLAGKQKGAFRNIYFRADLQHCFEQNKIYYKFGDETVTPAYTLLNLGAGTDIVSKGKTLCTLNVYAANITDVAYQSNMSRLKYGDPNNVTGRIGIYEMGRNFTVKLLIPINFSK